MSGTIINCVQCSRDFEFSEREQAFFEEKGFDPPKRCPECRRKKKVQFQDSNTGKKPETRKKRKHRFEKNADF